MDALAAGVADTLRALTLSRLMHDQRVDELLYFGDGPGLDDPGMRAAWGGVPGVATIGRDVHGAWFCGVPGLVAGDGNEDGRFVPAAASEAVFRSLRYRYPEDIFYRAILYGGVFYERETTLDLYAYLEAAEQYRGWPGLENVP